MNRIFVSVKVWTMDTQGDDERAAMVRETIYFDRTITESEIRKLIRVQHGPFHAIVSIDHEDAKRERDKARAINAELLAALKRIRDNIVPGETFDSFETDQIHEWASNSIAKAEGLTAG